MVLEGIDVSFAALSRLRPLALRSMPHLAAERLAIQRFLEAARPVTVAIASDQHRIGRLTVQVARSMGVRSVVIQHGLPQAPIGYLPVVADVVATWSRASEEWFAGAGAPPSSLVVTGNPRADRMRRAVGPIRGRNVLVVLGGGGPAPNLALVRDAARAARGIPGCVLQIKLHPGESALTPKAVMSTACREIPEQRVTVRHQEPIASLFDAASVVVLHRSTGAVEALMVGRPVIVHALPETGPGADTDLADLRLPVTTDESALRDAIVDLIDPQAAARFVESRIRGIEHAAGPQDGASVRRILELMRVDTSAGGRHPELSISSGGSFGRQGG
jgi:hypothetical protein